jgi:hypothetical protein
VDVDDNRRVVVRWPVDVQREFGPIIMLRKHQVLFNLHIHHLPCAFLAMGPTHSGKTSAPQQSAVTDHVAQGRTVTAGLAVITGTEDRQPCAALLACPAKTREPERKTG